MKKILAIDMGKFNSVACLYGMEGDTQQFETVPTQPTVFHDVFDQVCRGSKTRRKIAVVAVARRLLICCWAMLRDGKRWRDPSTNQTMAVPA